MTELRRLLSVRRVVTLHLVTRLVRRTMVLRIITTRQRRHLLLRLITVVRIVSAMRLARLVVTWVRGVRLLITGNRILRLSLVRILRWMRRLLPSRHLLLRQPQLMPTWGLEKRDAVRMWVMLLRRTRLFL